MASEVFELLAEVGLVEVARGLGEHFGFQETFRTSTSSPVKVEMALGGLNLGLALPEPAAESHGIDPVVSGHRACITLWTEEVDSAYRMALQAGAVDHAAPHRFLDGQLRVAFVEDPDGHPVQLVQRVASEAAPTSV